VVDAADNVVFGPHVNKWAKGGESLDQEALALAAVRSPHVVQCFGRCVDSVKYPGTIGISMERMQKTLHDVLHKRSSLKYAHQRLSLINCQCCLNKSA